MTPNVDLDGRVYVVTGAGRNVGRGIAERLAEAGGNVAVVDVDAENGERVVAEITDGGGEAIFVEADVTAEPEVEALVETVLDEWGRIDGLVSNVAITANKSVLECARKEWDDVIAGTLTSAFLCTKHCAAAMKETGGAIVNVGSTSAHRGTPNKVAHCAAKSGLLNFTRQTAVDLAEHDIRVNTLSPTRTGGAVGEAEGGIGRHTKGILRDRLGEPADHAAAALFLLSDEADFVTGTELVVDGGTLAGF